jgi:hypothetical protein
MTSKPTAEDRLHAAGRLMATADGRVSSLEHTLRQGERGELRVLTVAQIRSDLDLWKRVQSLAGREVRKWSTPDESTT